MLSNDIFVNTGNILNISDAKTKAIQNSGDELTEALRVVLQQTKGSGENVTTHINGPKDTELESLNRKELKITVKVFIASPVAESLKKALDEVFATLKTDNIESLVISFTNQENIDDILPSLQLLWSTVEEYVKLGKLSSVGLSDVSTNTFIDLFQWANVKPNIVQINLTSCCVVPPALQSFTKENDILLLTHSDPSQILPQSALDDIFGSGVSLHWVVKYQIHLKCRGILSSKGYLVYIKKPVA